MAQEIGIELGKSSVRQFSDGEIQVNIEESIRGKHVFILQSTSSPVNDNLLEILIMVDALKRASAESVNVVMPYYGYARQDRKARAREPITSKLVANMLEIRKRHDFLRYICIACAFHKIFPSTIVALFTLFFKRMMQGYKYGALLLFLIEK